MTLRARLQVGCFVTEILGVIYAAAGVFGTRTDVEIGLAVITAGMCGHIVLETRIP